MKATVAMLGMVLAFSCACVSVSPRAERVPLLPAESAQLAGCAKLGSVRAEASGLSQINWMNAEEQAKNNLRDAAVAKWNEQVNAVALIDVTRATTKVVAHGLGYHCGQ
jgi:hypothetical protein